MARKVFRKGREGIRKSGGDNRFISIKADESIVVAPMVDIADLISVDMHSWWDVNPAPHLVCLGEECPSCALGHEARYKAYLPVLTREGEPKVLAAGISVVRQLEDLEDEIGHIKGNVLKIKRTGSSWMSTKYSVIPIGKKVDTSKYEVLDVESMLGPVTREDQIDALRSAGIDVSELEETAKPKRRATKAKKADEEKAEDDAPAEVPWGDDDGGDEGGDEDGWAEL